MVFNFRIHIYIESHKYSRILEIWHYMARLEAGEDVTVPISANDVRVLEAV